MAKWVCKRKSLNEMNKIKLIWFGGRSPSTSKWESWTQRMESFIESLQNLSGTYFLVIYVSIILTRSRADKSSRLHRDSSLRAVLCHPKFSRASNPEKKLGWPPALDNLHLFLMPWKQEAEKQTKPWFAWWIRKIRIHLEILSVCSPSEQRAVWLWVKGKHRMSKNLFCLDVSMHQGQKE